MAERFSGNRHGEGAVEFWIVDAKSQTVTVHTKTGMAVYVAGLSVPVEMFDGQIGVNDLFAGC